MRRYAIALCLLLLASPAAWPADMPAVSVASITAKYGKPDSVTGTANDKPRPMIVTQFVDYKRQRVRFVLMADAPIGSPPPYNRWLLMGTTDPITNKRISADEVTQRMTR